MNRAAGGSAPARHAVRYAAAAGALAAAGLAAAGCGSSGTSSSAASPSAAARTGTQTLAGTLTGGAALGSASAIPLRLTGVVNTGASISLGGGQRNPVMIKTGQGTLALTHSAGTSSQKLLSTRTCEFAFGQRTHYTVAGGKSSGAFKGATGNGNAVVTLTGNLPKNASGTCDTSPSAVPKSATARLSFVARGPLTVRK